ncbi:MAG: hypothetical protein AAF690_18795 [Acidobacteriota bacterium]
MARSLRRRTEELLAPQPARWTLPFDLLRGAVDAHLNPHLSSRPAPAMAKKGQPVLRISACEPPRSTQTLLGASLVLACAGLLATWWPGSSGDVGSLILLSAFPWALLLAEIPEVWTESRRRQRLLSIGARAVLVTTMMLAALALGRLL